MASPGLELRTGLIAGCNWSFGHDADRHPPPDFS
jgi:hypothetical protein